MQGVILIGVTNSALRGKKGEGQQTVDCRTQEPIRYGTQSAVVLDVFHAPADGARQKHDCRALREDHTRIEAGLGESGELVQNAPSHIAWALRPDREGRAAGDVAWVIFGSFNAIKALD